MPKRDEEQHSQSNVFSTFHHPSQGFSRRHPHAYIGMRQQVANHQSHLLRINPLAREVVQNALGLNGVNVLSHSWPPGPAVFGGNWHLRDIQELKITFMFIHTLTKVSHVFSKNFLWRLAILDSAPRKTNSGVCPPLSTVNTKEPGIELTYILKT